MEKTRFSKAFVSNDLYDKIERLEKEHGFDRGNGWKQVEGKGEAKNRAFAEWRAYLDLLSQWF